MEQSIRMGKYILNTAHQLKVKLDSSFDDDGLNGLQARILCLIEHNSLAGKEVYQRDIEAEFKIRRSSVSSVLDTMEKNGYIIRQSVESDGRLKKLALTDKAKKFGCEHRKAIDAFEENIIKGFSEEEIVTLKNLLGRIVANVEEMRDENND